MTAVLESGREVQIYNDLSACLGKTLGWEVKVVSGLSYANADNMLDVNGARNNMLVAALMLSQQA